MGWFAGQLLWYLLGAFLLGLLAGYLWWVWGWKKYREEQVTSDVDRRTKRSVTAGVSADSGTGAAAGVSTLVGATTPGAAVNGTDGLRRKLSEAEEELRLERQRSAELGDEAETLRGRIEAQSEELRTASSALDAAREQAKAADIEREQIIDLRDEAESLRERVRILESATAATAGAGTAAARSGAGGSGAATVQGLVGASATPGSAPSGRPNDVRADGDRADHNEAGVGDVQVGSDEATDAVDALERIEGIGPKIGDALRAAGIGSFARLAAADEATLRAAIEAAGLRFAPSLPTWAAQARFLVDGDDAGFTAYTTRLVAGRDPGTAKGER